MTGSSTKLFTLLLFCNIRNFTQMYSTRCVGYVVWIHNDRPHAKIFDQGSSKNASKKSDRNPRTVCGLDQNIHIARFD